MTTSGRHEALVGETPAGPAAARPGTDESGPFDLRPDDPFGEEVDSAETNPVEKLEHTPLPLPPSPAEDHLDGFLAESPTHPGKQDLASLDDGLITSTRRPAGSDDWPLQSETRPPPRPPIPWKLPAVVGVLCLVIGMLLGALLF